MQAADTGRIGLVYATPAGRAHALELERSLGNCELFEGPPSQTLAQAFSGCDAVVCFLATGATVRLLSPLLQDKANDPGVVCVDEAARYAIALCGAQAGGANELARRVADVLDCEPVVTTATDARDIPALESLGAHLGLRLEPDGDLAAVAAAIVAGDRVELVADAKLPLEPIASNICELERPSHTTAAILITDRTQPGPRPSIVYRPPTLVVGVGCIAGAKASSIEALVADTLESHGLSAASVCCVATLERKAKEPGLVELCQKLGWRLEAFSAGDLAAVSVPNPSSPVERAVQTPSVAEAAALRSASASGAGDVELVVQKQKSGEATVAVARRHIRGRLALVSVGPGDESLICDAARAELRRARVVMGLGRYVDSVAKILRPATRTERFELGSEVERSRAAVKAAAGGESVALVSGGDVGIYAMASPALEQAEGEPVEVFVVPGVSAANACAALVGAPLAADHCSISLSDYLCAWETIAARLQSCGEADLVAVLYNPRSSQRSWQLAAALSILSEHRPPTTPVAFVTDAYRPGQHVHLTTLQAADARDASMTTTVIVGNSQTHLRDGQMVTPRGYEARIERAGELAR